MTEPAHITKAKALLSRATTADDEPLGFTSSSDIREAERRLAAAMAQLRDYNLGDEHMYESLDGQTKMKQLNVDKLRFEMIDNLRNKVSRRQGELTSVKRAWLADVLKGF